MIGLEGFLHQGFHLALVFAVSPVAVAEDEAQAKRLGELDAYWTEVSRTVREGDFKGYKATCHPKGVLVSGRKKTSYPLSTALAGWKKEFDD